MVGWTQDGHIAAEGLIDRVAHELASEVEDGEHGAGAAGITLVMKLEPAGERLLIDDPQDEEAEQGDERQGGEALAAAREG